MNIGETILMVFFTIFILFAFIFVTFFMIHDFTADQEIKIRIDCVDGEGNRNLEGVKCEKTLRCGGWPSFLDPEECDKSGGGRR